MVLSIWKGFTDYCVAGYAVLRPPKQQCMGLMHPVHSSSSNTPGSVGDHAHSDIHCNDPHWEPVIQQLQEKQSQLEALSAELTAAEDSLVSLQQQRQQFQASSYASSPEPSDPLTLEGMHQGVKAEGAACVTSSVHTAPALVLQHSRLAAQRSELLLRWQCLLEDKKQLNLMMAAAAAGESLI